MKVDQKDRRIIVELIRDSNQTSRKISKKTGIPITTVHNRIRKLKNMGVIINYTINLDYKKLGRPILAFITVTINYNVPGEKINQSEVAKKIKSLDGVYDVSILTGGADILSKVLAKDIEDLNDLVTYRLRNIPGIDKTQTSIVLKQV